MDDCIFCKIIKGEIPSTKVYEDDKVLAFKDINPQAPVHILVIPKQHIESVSGLNEQNADIVSHIMLIIGKLAEEYHLEGGYRVISNVGDDAGQTVHHLHFHILGGKKLSIQMC